KKPKEQVKLFYNTDVHSHILPGVDHGSQNVEESLAMLQDEIDMGITRVMCTSHVTADTFENTPESLTAAYEILKQAVAEAGMNIEIHASAEYRIDEYWNEQYKAGAILPLPGNYLLLENSFAQELIGIDQLMFDLRVKKYNPILAHPERYGYYYDRKERYKYLHSAGVKFQVNILSLEGFFGGRARSAAMWLIENNLVDMLGSDMHNHEQGEIIKEYLQSKDWRKISERLQGRMINDLVR
ncbi:MAG: hypothetical protein IK092_06260, partial [Muribaculaceae bacterium]|nr:hypothetical protein [Muribaculaceae bacterium]